MVDKAKEGAAWSLRREGWTAAGMVRSRVVFLRLGQVGSRASRQGSGSGHALTQVASPLNGQKRLGVRPLSACCSRLP